MPILQIKCAIQLTTYTIVSKEKRKVLEEIMRSDKKDKSIQTISLINQKGQGRKNYSQKKELRQLLGGVRQEN